MDNPGILIPLSEYLFKKDAIKLRATCKMMKNYIKVKQFKLKFNLTSLHLIKTFIDYPGSYHLTFIDIINSLKQFKFFNALQFNKLHYNLIYTFFIYRYFIHEYSFSFIENELPFLYYYRFYLDPLLIDSIYHMEFNKIEELKIEKIYEIVKKTNNGSLDFYELFII